MLVSQALRTLSEQLKPLSETSILDSQVLLAQVLGKPRAWILAHPEAAMTNQQRLELQSALERLLAGEALPYVLGHWEFFGLDFSLTPAVLIPRPETELLVEQALGWLHSHPDRHRAADIGTGSGCIAVTLASKIPDLHMAASDISQGALQVARHNAIRHAVEARVQFIQADLLSFPNPLTPQPADKPRFDLIAANLPYIPTHRLGSLEVARREPRLALDGGSDGLSMIRRLIEQAPAALAPGGLMLLELDCSHAGAASDIAHTFFPKAAVSVLPDLNELDRLLKIETILEDN